MVRNVRLSHGQATTEFDKKENVFFPLLLATKENTHAQCIKGTANKKLQEKAKNIMKWTTKVWRVVRRSRVFFFRFFFVRFCATNICLGLVCVCVNAKIAFYRILFGFWMRNRNDFRQMRSHVVWFEVCFRTHFSVVVGKLLFVRKIYLCLFFSTNQMHACLAHMRHQRLILSSVNPNDK